MNLTRTGLAFLTLVALATGCAGTAQYFPRNADTYPQRAANCEFEVFTSRPDGYTEIGRVELQPRALSDSHASIEVFADKVRPEVCNAGGHAVHVQSTANGPEVLGVSRAYWTLGTVLRRTEDLPE